MFLDRRDESFLTQVVEEPMKTDALLDLIHTNKERLTGETKVEGSLVCITISPQAWTSGEQTLVSLVICLEEF